MSLLLPVLQGSRGASYDSQVLRAPSFSSLVAWFPGYAAIDSRGLFTGGTVVEPVEFTGTAIPQDPPSARESAQHAGGYIYYPHPAALASLSQGTFIAVVRPNGGTLRDLRAVFSREEEVAAPPTGLRKQTGVWWNGAPNFWLSWFIVDDSYQQRNIRADYALSEQAVQCVAASWGPAGMRLMVDGDIVGTNSYTGAAPVQPARRWFHGATGFSGVAADFWLGLLAHLQQYNRQLSDAEKRTLMPTPGPRVIQPQIYNNNGSTFYQNAFTMSSRTNRKLIVIIGKDSAAVISNVKWGATPMRLVREAGTGTLRLHIYELLNPTGSANIQYSTTNPNTVVCIALEVGHTKQADLAGAVVHVSPDTTSSSITLPSVKAGSLAIGACMAGLGSTSIAKTGDGAAILGLLDNDNFSVFRATLLQRIPLADQDVRFSYTLSQPDSFVQVGIVLNGI